jgi:hypothetical protein
MEPSEFQMVVNVELQLPAGHAFATFQSSSRDLTEILQYSTLV